MPRYNGLDVSWEHLDEIACHTSSGYCDICNVTFSYLQVPGILLRNPSSGYLMKVCFSCFRNLEFLANSEDCSRYLTTALCSRCHCEKNITVFNYINSLAVCHNCYTAAAAVTMETTAPRNSSDNTWECFSCHTEFSYIVPRLWMRNDNSEEQPVCLACAENRNDFIFSYNFNPEFRYYKTNKDKHELLHFGIELEIESCGGDEKDAVKSLPGFVYPKYDSSIRDGFEIVSHPMTYNWLKDNCDKWDKILDLRKKGWCSYNTETCGMHIHLSEAAFGTYHLFKFMKMFYDNTDFIIRFSQRKAHNLQQWASTTDRERNIIYKAKHKNMYYGENRHTAVNLGRENTVEVRIFRGTLCPPSFWKNIEFTKALYDFSRDYAAKDMNEIKFRSFIRFKRKLYPNLHSFVWDNNKMKYSVEE